MADTRSTPGDAKTTAAAGLATADTTAAGSRTAGILKTGKDEALTEAKAMVRDAAEEQRRRAAGAVGGIAGALRRAAGDLRPENETVGRYTQMAAQQLDEVAEYLRTSNFDDVLSGAEDLARRQPYWFVGGAMAAGFLLARMIKSGAEQQSLGAVERADRRLAAAAASVGAAGAVTPGGSGTATPRTEL